MELPSGSSSTASSSALVGELAGSKPWYAGRPQPPESGWERVLELFHKDSYLLQVQTKDDVILSAVLADLEKIKTCSKIDASLYTAEITDHSECKASVMKCFILEMEVILYESKYGTDNTFTNAVHNVLKNVHHHSLVKNQSNETSMCQQCETFEEKKCTEFLKRFEVFIKQFNAELEEKNPHKTVSRKLRTGF